MADTRRGIHWSLERPCPLRTGEGWALPRATSRQLADVSTYSNALPDGLVVNDICVTSYTFGSDSAGNSVILPCSGFRVSLALSAFGGEAAIRAACGACEANVTRDHKSTFAGCHGFLDAWPDSEELESELRDKVRLKGLAAELDTLFPRTTPLWYGFWIESPLRRPHCEALLALLEGTDDPAETRDDDLRHFLAALRAAIDWELPLHVEMALPGHTDFGWYTIFPHCPRCKAHAPLARWQESYPDESIDCMVCGHRYSPAKTHKEERMDETAWDAQRLENVLGAGAVEGFRRRFLAHRGCTSEQIDDILDRENDGPLKRRINDLRRRQDATRRALPARGHQTDSLPDKLVVDVGDNAPMRLLLVREGDFLMGTMGPADEAGCEGPQHVVRIAAPFYLGEFPVTQVQFATVMGRNPSRFKGDSDRPVEQVSWFMAQEFCLRMSDTIGRRVRLPSEAEWEYACRAGAASKYHWGDEATAELVNCKTGDPLAALTDDFSTKDQDVTTNVQGRFPPNSWGFYDMLGNVQEWCEDEWHNDYAGAPTDGSAWVTAGDEEPFRPVRGGSCRHFATACTSAARQQLRADACDEPEELLDDDLIGAVLRSFPPVGFRVVVEVD
ncbi:MAG: formylglycine-generating enzyme family protein [Gemmataceae bacterium]|nr:formylglycine-generating enzyme family protein [Gemmataceae bacterium]